ncbi:ribosomal protein S8 [Clostridium tetanomorphum]|uniref:Uncharacterized protein n=1 Tax=Clostridium tetanomorphum TaxID=1553 RepID=A0A923J1L1_CLOTT|nr:hypothetical protein [Clostridium tetanomorphum]MBC2399356.1 hypothetical protein [Clostridium tetanomorphum]MBP1865853.1 ribosomal protein S8 [Clostridium tetanomorphum]NRS85302.1 ribosomal protein S8 [Clostridium tetanomorphum]NRZ98481.1 ribosomal protein S8 [Clostridium tetanomorphum]SQC02983.1 Uncharacterised protein [Clostridium tetanomorphum]
MVYKYNNYYYWENLIITGQNIWDSHFMNLPLNEKSIFINTSIIDYQQNIFENNWCCYPNILATLGFLQYVYLPTAFFNILNCKADELFVPICSSEEFISELNKTDKYITYMNPSQNFDKYILELNTYWTLNENACIDKLKNFCKKFNNAWNKQDTILSINIFLKPQEIAEYIMNDKNDTVFLEVIEEEIGLTKDELFHLCNNLYNNEFMKKNFVELLNNKISCITY